MTYHLARAVGENDTVLWLSTPQVDIDYLERAVSIAYNRTLRAALDHGRASTQYAVESAVLAGVEADLALAVSRIDPTVSAIVQDNVLTCEAEYLTVRFVSEETVEVGRAGYGTARAAHVAGTPLYSTALRVEAVLDVQLIIEGSPISSGDKGDVTLAFPGRISGVRLLADQPGDIVIDVRKTSFPDLPDMGGDSIVAAAKPTLTADLTYEDTTLTGWDTSFSRGDVLRFVVESASTVTRVTISLTCTTAV